VATTWPHPDQHRSVPYFVLPPEPNARHNLEAITTSSHTIEGTILNASDANIDKDKTQAIECLQGYFKKAGEQNVVVEALPQIL
jgi:hypothetical protein